MTGSTEGAPGAPGGWRTGPREDEVPNRRDAARIVLATGHSGHTDDAGHTADAVRVPA